MSSTDFKTDLALLLFNNTNIGALGDTTGVRGSSVAGSIYVALHVTDPGAGGKQNTGEATFGLYARQAVARASGAGGWTCSAGAISNASAITYAEANSGSETINYFSIGYEVSGATKMLASAVVTTPRAVSTGVTLSFAVGDLDVTIS